MLILAIALMAAPQETLRCSGGIAHRACQNDAGETFTENRSESRITREWLDTNGRRSTEYINLTPDGGGRLSGSDEQGHTWYQNCRPGYGTTGTDRSGAAIFIPPVKVQVADGVFGYTTCFGG